MITSTGSGINDFDSAVSPELKASGHPIVDGFPDTWADGSADNGARIDG